jgi:hypothetical protein
VRALGLASTLTGKLQPIWALSKKAYPQIRAGGLATSVQKDNERFVGTIVLSVSYPRSLTPPTCI